MRSAGFLSPPWDRALFFSCLLLFPLWRAAACHFLRVQQDGMWGKREKNWKHGGGRAHDQGRQCVNSNIHCFSTVFTSEGPRGYVDHKPLLSVVGTYAQKTKKPQKKPRSKVILSLKRKTYLHPFQEIINNNRNCQQGYIKTLRGVGKTRFFQLFFYIRRGH